MHDMHPYWTRRRGSSIHWRDGGHIDACHRQLLQTNGALVAQAEAGGRRGGRGWWPSRQVDLPRTCPISAGAIGLATVAEFQQEAVRSDNLVCTARSGWRGRSLGMALRREEARRCCLIFVSPGHIHMTS